MISRLLTTLLLLILIQLNEVHSKEEKIQTRNSLKSLRGSGRGAEQEQAKKNEIDDEVYYSIGNGTYRIHEDNSSSLINIEQKIHEVAKPNLEAIFNPSNASKILEAFRAIEPLHLRANHSSTDDEDQGQDQQERNLQGSKTTLIIQNECADNVHLSLLYFSEQGGLQFEGWYQLPNLQTIAFANVNQHTFYLFAMSDAYYRWDGISVYCYDSKNCFQPITMPSLEPTEVIYKINCQGKSSGGRFDSSLTKKDTSSQASTSESASQSPNGLTEYAQAWLKVHNIRRERLHTENGLSFVPLKWSNSLAQSSQEYAEKLKNGFHDCHIEHKYLGDSYGGENLAATWGSSSSITSEYSTFDRIMVRWYDNEIALPFGPNGHYTQVGWRATKYVGCGDVFYQLPNRQHCRIQVCRYLAPGNCGVDATNFFQKMLEPTAYCPPACPEEGCF